MPISHSAHSGTISMTNTNLTTVRSRVAKTLHALADRLDVPAKSTQTRAVIVRGFGFPAGTTVSDTSDVINDQGHCDGFVSWSATADQHGAFTVRVTVSGPGLTLRPRATFDGDVSIVEDERHAE